ncbi:cytochrome P450 [Polyangium aurulentum]|uniref:cytochrome P450 n=1 Tax=Polyangium aurulentum TaxID=2567896 RepID=UPI0010AEB2C6|nr:cytochrome P450 [Polyangium aurulentum]UQA56956.1 cytochrome P450 [Polyangium aurulentum]
MERLNLFDLEYRKDPYRYHAELRRSAPVTQVDPGGMWAVSRYDDIVEILKQPTRFSSYGQRAAAIQPWLERNPLADSIAMMDPPQHTKLRAFATDAFKVRVLPRIEPLARAVARDFVSRARGGGEIDVCDDIASRMPMGVIANLLGIESAHRQRIRAWNDDIIAINPGTPPEAQPRIRASIEEQERYLLEVIEERRRARRDDLVSDLLDAEIDGRRLTDAEIMSFLFVFVVAGYETSSHMLTHALRILAAHPSLLDRLRADPAGIPGFIEELLRFEAPVQVVVRLAVAEEEIAGVRLPAGAVVLLLLASANRDERHFEDPDRFDMDRRQRVSIPFGHGVHFCLGAALARAEARFALEEILPQIHGAHVTQEPTWNMSLTARGPLTCWMKFDPA